MSAPRPRSEYTPPDGTRRGTLTIDAATLPDVLGYVSQCDCCGQRAVTREPYGRDWTCPRCAEVVDNDPYHADEPAPAAFASMTLPADDPLAQAIRAADDPLAQAIRAATDQMPPPAITATVGGQMFVLDEWSEERQVCVCGKPHGPAIVTTSWSPAAAWTMRGPGRFTVSVDDDGYPIGKVQG